MAALTDIVMQRYIELEGQFKRVVSVVKVRGSGHSKDIRFYDIDAEGMKIGAALSQYKGILSGEPYRA